MTQRCFCQRIGEQRGGLIGFELIWADILYMASR